MPYTNDQRKDTKEYIVRKDDIAMNVDFGNCHKTTMEDGDGASFFCVSPTLGLTKAKRTVPIFALSLIIFKLCLLLVYVPASAASFFFSRLSE